MARHMGRPVLAVNLDSPFDIDAAVAWIRGKHIHVLHVGGQRESSCPGIYEAAKRHIETLLARLEDTE